MKTENVNMPTHSNARQPHFRESVAGGAAGRGLAANFMVLVAMMIGGLAGDLAVAGPVLAVIARQDSNIYFMNATTGALEGSIDTGVTGAGALAADSSRRVFYFTGPPNGGNNHTLYSIGFEGGPAQVIGEITGDIDELNSLGYDPFGDALYGVASGRGVYTINTNTAVTTRRRAFSVSLEGFDVDPVTGLAYFSNTSAIREYILPGALGASVYDHSALGNDFDGMGVYNGVAYLVNDEANGDIYKVDLASDTVLATFTTPFSSDSAASGATIFLNVPEPASAMLTIFALGATIRRRRGA